MKKMFLLLALALLAFSIPASAQTLGSQAQLPSGAQSLTQLLGPNFQSPWITYSTSSLVVSWNTGIIYTPNGQINIVPGSLTLTASASSCGRAAGGGFTSCDFIYSNSSGTMATTQALATASAPGNSILAYVTTSSSGVITLVTPYMDTSAFGVPVFQPSNPSSIFNFSTAAQSQVVVSATEYYLTNSNLNMPAVYTTPIAAGTTMSWRFAINKTAAGTGTFQILLKKGTNGSTADTALVTQTIGTQSAAADNGECDVTLTWTSATAAYWTITFRQSAATATGFGLAYPAVAADFNGTISGQTTTTASDKYGLSVVFTTGTPTFIVTEMQARAFGVN